MIYILAWDRPIPATTPSNIDIPEHIAVTLDTLPEATDRSLNQEASGYPRPVIERLVPPQSREKSWENFPHQICLLVNLADLQGFRDAPERIRTSDLRFRRPTLYPAELRAQSRLAYRHGGSTPPRPVFQSQSGWAASVSGSNTIAFECPSLKPSTGCAVHPVPSTAPSSLVSEPPRMFSAGPAPMFCTGTISFPLCRAGPAAASETMPRGTPPEAKSCQTQWPGDRTVGR
jgi:hypothetical protein